MNSCYKTPLYKTLYNTVQGSCILLCITINQTSYLIKMLTDGFKTYTWVYIKSRKIEDVWGNDLHIPGCISSLERLRMSGEMTYIYLGVYQV